MNQVEQKLKMIEEESKQNLEVMLLRNKSRNNMLEAMIRTARQQAKRQVFDEIWRMWSNRYGDDKTSNETIFDMHQIIREVEKQLLGEKK